MLQVNNSRNQVTTAASHYVLDLLDPGSSLWIIGRETVKEGADFSTFDDNDLITILIDQLEDFLLDKWQGNETFSPAIYAVLCVFLSDVEWDVILIDFIPQWYESIEQEKQERIAQQKMLQLFADACDF